VAKDAIVLALKALNGGLFVANGNTAVAASGQGGLMVRVEPEESDALVAGSQARPVEMHAAGS
jgi:hypothetical protein